jgi:ATP-dependent helicase/nuclease subunit A
MCPGSSKEDCPASKGAREARQARTDAETLRLLYVALTRSRDRLILMGRACGNSKQGFDEGSWWHVLTETFRRLDEDGPENVRDVGDGVLRFGADPATASAAMVEARTAAPVPTWARQQPAPDASGRLLSPSRMDETTRIPAPSPLATTGGPGASLGRFRRGDLIHRLLERLPDLPPSDRADAARRMLARERDLDDAVRADIAEAAFRVLDDPLFGPVFGPGSRAEVALTGQIGGVAVSGRMDRLVVTPERVLVIDYKTNRPPPARIEDADPAYVRQMAVYAAVLVEIYPDRAVEAAIVWTDEPGLMPVPAALMQAALTG